MNTQIRRQNGPKLTRRAQSGAALVIGLILLMVLTLLAISGMNTATVELQMAGNMQYSQRAFQAAEIGIERAMRSGSYNTSVVSSVPDTLLVAGEPDKFNTVTRFDTAAGVTQVPSGGFSMGVGYNAYHFDITSTGASARGAQDVHVQSFYVVGPGS